MTRPSWLLGLLPLLGSLSALGCGEILDISDFGPEDPTGTSSGTGGVGGDKDPPSGGSGGSGGSSGSGGGSCAAPLGNHLWSLSFGAEESDLATEVAVDSDGIAIVTGQLSGNVSIDGQTLTAGLGDVFVAKLDPDGGHGWSQAWSSNAGLSVWDVAVGPDQRPVIVGGHAGAVNFGHGVIDVPNPGVQPNIFVVKLGDPGQGFSRTFGDEAPQRATAVAVDSSGNVVVTGAMQGTVSFGGNDLVGAGENDVFVAKLSPTGGHLWSVRWGNAAVQAGLGIAVDSQDNVLVVGSFEGSMQVGGSTLTSNGFDAFVVKLSANGAPSFSKQLGGMGNATASAVAADPANGEVLVTGSFDGTLTTDEGVTLQAHADGTDAFVLRLAPNGSHLASKVYGSVGNDAGGRIVVDSAGNIVVAGSFSGAIDFADPLECGGEDNVKCPGGIPCVDDPNDECYPVGGAGSCPGFCDQALYSEGGLDGFIAKLTPNLGYHWSRRLGRQGEDAAAGLAVDSACNVIAAGWFEQAMSFTTDPSDALTSQGGKDIFVVKLGP